MYIVWSLVRRRATRRLIRLQILHNVLKHIKTFGNGCGSVVVNFFNLLMFSTVPAKYNCGYRAVRVRVQC